EFRRVLFRSPGRQNDSVAVGGCGRWARKECGYLAERFSQTSAGRLTIRRQLPPCPTSYATGFENVEIPGAVPWACQLFLGSEAAGGSACPTKITERSSSPRAGGNCAPPCR